MLCFLFGISCAILPNTLHVSSYEIAAAAMNSLAPQETITLQVRCSGAYDADYVQKNIDMAQKLSHNLQSWVTWRRPYYRVVVQFNGECLIAKPITINNEGPITINGGIFVAAKNLDAHSTSVGRNFEYKGEFDARH